MNALWMGALAAMALAAGERHRPKGQDCVRIYYTAWKQDGTMVADWPRTAAPEVQCLRRMSPGIAGALRAMAVGERRRVFVPARLALVDDDERGPPPIDLTYDLELVDVIRAPTPPPQLRGPPRGARTTASGVAHQILKKGTGTAHPTLANQVTVHLSGWTRDGTLVESTVMAAHPAVFPVRDLLPGLRVGVQLLVAGDSARFWIPAALAYGDKPRRRGQPAGPLVYEVELLAIQ